MHIIIIKQKEWYKRFKEGQIKICEIKLNKRKIYLNSLSVCVLACKIDEKPFKEWEIFGEFLVEKTRIVDKNEYEKLVKKDLIVESKEKAERFFLIEFSAYIIYPNKIKFKELMDVKIKDNPKPISEWNFVNIAYIDENALKIIRKKAGLPL